MLNLELPQLSRTLDHLLGLSRMEITTSVEFEDFWEWKTVLLHDDPEPTKAAPHE